MPKLIFFSKSFFQTKEAVFIFRLVKQGIETLVPDEEIKTRMVEQLYLAFECGFDENKYESPAYTQLQILEVCCIDIIVSNICDQCVYRNK